MTDETTMVRVGTTIDGDLRGDEDVRVEGRISGSIDVAGTVTIERTGVVRGDVRARAVIVSGLCVGSIQAANYVAVLESARVIGDVVAPRVDVDPRANLTSRAPSSLLPPADGEPVRSVLSGGEDGRSRPGIRRAPPPSLPRFERAVARRRASP